MTSVVRAHRSSPLLNLALASVVFLALGAAIEGGSRYWESTHPAPTPVADYLWDWETMWDGDFYTVDNGALGWPRDEWFNVDGLRDRSHTVEKPPRSYRLVFLGDSVTLGAGIPPERAYPQVLRRRLEGAGRRIEVFNAALWGWSTRQERTAYERLVRRYRPDRVVLAVCLNDIPELQNNLTRPMPWLQRLYERSALVRLLVNAQGREIARVEHLFTQPDSAVVRAGFERFVGELRALRRAVQADGADLAVAVFPFRFQVEPNAPAPSVQSRLRELCREEGLPFLDLLPALEPLGSKAYVDYDHLSVLGARSAAEALLGSALVPDGHAYALDLGLRQGEHAPLARLLRSLAGPDAAEREAAAWALARHLAAVEVPRALAARLASDADEGVRSAAADTLARSPDAAQASSGQLFAALDDPSECVRWAAARALAERPLPGDGRVAGEVERLIGRLRHADRYVRAFAAWSLGRLGSGASLAAPALVEALQLEGRSAGVAANALVELGPAGMAQVPALIGVLSSPEPERRWNAALALGLLGRGARLAAPRLVALLEDRDSHVRAKAALALGLIGTTDAGAADALKAAVRDDPAPEVRAMAARSLGRLRPSDSATERVLIAALDDDSHRVRVEAKHGLAAFHGETLRDPEARSR